MPLIKNTYGKGRVRVMRIERDTAHHVVHELTVLAMLEGGFDRAFTDQDNAQVISTDTIKNLVNIVARENLDLGNELFCQAVAARFFDRFPQVAKATITAWETKWNRLEVAGKPHDHSFTLDGNGKPTAKVTMTKGETIVESGVDGFTFMKTTQSGWANYLMDPYTTIKETDDRIAATSMVASWRWSKQPASYEAANGTVLQTALDVFAGTYSTSVQDSLYRMGEAVLAAVPEVQQIAMACPNKHYLLMNLQAFGLDNPNRVFLPTDEPHGQIECVVGRG